MAHEITWIGSAEDPARCTGWNTGGTLPPNMMVLTINDNGKAVYLTMDAQSIHDMVKSLFPMAKKYAPLHDGDECPVCERTLPELDDEDQS